MLGYLYRLPDARGERQGVVLMMEDVTEREQDVAALRDSEERFRVVLLHSSIAATTYRRAAARCGRRRHRYYLHHAGHHGTTNNEGLKSSPFPSMGEGAGAG